MTEVQVAELVHNTVDRINQSASELKPLPHLPEASLALQAALATSER